MDFEEFTVMIKSLYPRDAVGKHNLGEATPDDYSQFAKEMLGSEPGFGNVGREYREKAGLVLVQLKNRRYNDDDAVAVGSALVRLLLCPGT